MPQLSMIVLCFLFNFPKVYHVQSLKFLHHACDIQSDVRNWISVTKMQKND